MAHLPIEIWSHIFSFLEIRELWSTRLVSRFYCILADKELSDLDIVISNHEIVRALHQRGYRVLTLQTFFPPHIKLLPPTYGWTLRGRYCNIWTDSNPLPCSALTLEKITLQQIPAYVDHLYLHKCCIEPTMIFLPHQEVTMEKVRLPRSTHLKGGACLEKLWLNIHHLPQSLKISHCSFVKMHCFGTKESQNEIIFRKCQEIKVFKCRFVSCPRVQITCRYGSPELSADDAYPELYYNVRLRLPEQKIIIENLHLTNLANLDKFGVGTLHLHSLNWSEYQEKSFPKIRKVIIYGPPPPYYASLFSAAEILFHS